MAKTRKVMEIDFYGHIYVCIEDSTAKYNPYKLYEKYWDGGWHKKKITEYADIDSVLFHLMQMRYNKVQWNIA